MEAGIAMLDAPVSGGTTGEAATIAIMVGGDKKVFDDACRCCSRSAPT